MIRHLAAATILGIALTGCATTEGSTDDSPPAGTNADKSSDTTEDTETAEPEPAQPTFGQAYTYKDGLTVKVGRPRPFTPSEYAASGPGPAIVFTFTVVNKTGAPYDPSLFYATLQSGNKEASEIYDSEKGINGSPQTKVLNGRESQWKAAWNVKNPRDLVLELSPDAGIEYESVIFTR